MIYPINQKSKCLKLLPRAFYCLHFLLLTAHSSRIAGLVRATENCEKGPSERIAKIRKGPNAESFGPPLCGDLSEPLCICWGVLYALCVSSKRIERAVDVQDYFILKDQQDKNYLVIPWPRPILHGLVASSSLPKYYTNMVCPCKIAPGRAC